jgi:hypothetical protein
VEADGIDLRRQGGDGTVASSGEAFIARHGQPPHPTTGKRVAVVGNDHFETLIE